MNQKQYNSLKEEYKKFFRWVYVGEKQADGIEYKYSFNSTHKDLIPSSHVNINGAKCPYCGGQMYPIQSRIEEYNDYTTTGYVCFCERAQLELEYKAELEKIKKRHNKEIGELQSKYRKELKFNKIKLLEIEFEGKMEYAKKGWREVNAIDRCQDEW